MRANALQNNYPALSFWEREVFFREADVVVVGSGIVGLTAAIHLKEQDANLRVVLVERGTLPIGASTRNAGFACFGSMTELLDDLQRQSTSAVFALVEKRWRGLQRLRERLGDTQLEYRAYGGYELFKSEEMAAAEVCKNHLDDFNQNLKGITKMDQTFSVPKDLIAKLGFQGVQETIWNQAEGQIHTGKMMYALVQLAKEKGVEIFTGLEVQELESKDNGSILHFTNTWKLRSQKILIATNGFAPQLLPELDVRPARNQVLITKPIANLPFKGCFHYDRGYYYFRNINGRILLGGGRNLSPEAETTAAFGTTDLIKSNLLQLLQEVILPQQTVEVDYWWSGILGVGEQKTSIVQQQAPGIYVAVRLGGMGVAIGSLIGEEAADLILA